METLNPNEVALIGGLVEYRRICENLSLLAKKLGVEVDTSETHAVTLGRCVRRVEQLVAEVDSLRVLIVELYSSV